MMKKIFFYIFSIAVFLQGCSTDDNMFDPLEGDKMIFPAQSQELGKEVAKELRGIVSRLNEMGVDYSDADSSPEFKQRFYGNLNQTMSRNLLRSANATSQIQMPSEVFIEKVKNLTEVQIRFVERIIEECEKSTSYDDLSKRLLAINKDISASVPEIQQERLFNITAVLYYGIKEIQDLDKQGQMLPTPYNVAPIRLKSGNESGGGWNSKCTRFLATVWTIAIGEPTPAGEIVASIITVIVGGILLYEVITCPKNDQSNNEYCQERFRNCYSPIFDGCSICLQYCLAQGAWPPYSTHQCS